MILFTAGGRHEVNFEKQVYLFLTYFAHTGVYRTNSNYNDVSKSTFHSIVNGIMRLVMKHLWKKYVTWPTKDEQIETERYYKEERGFPGVIGSVDGTHIIIKRPQDFDQDFYNIRGQKHSLILQVTKLLKSQLC